MQTELFVHNNDHGVSKQISADIEQSVGWFLHTGASRSFLIHSGPHLASKRDFAL